MNANLRNVGKRANSEPVDREEPPTGTVKGSGGPRSILVTVNLVVFLFHVSTFMNRGTMPYLAKKLGVSNTVFGYFSATSGLALLVGGPLYGRFGDVYGGRLSLTVSFLGMAMVTGMIAVCDSIPVFFLTRLPLLLVHVLPSCQMVVADVTDDASRTGALSMLGLSVIIGISIGSLFGGVVTERYGTSTSNLIACMLCLLSVVLVWINIPTHTKRKKQDKPKTKGGVFDVAELSRLMKVPAVKRLLGTKFILRMSGMIIQSSMPVVFRDIFGVGPQGSGIFVMTVGILGAVFQAGAMGRLTKRYKDDTLILFSSGLTVVAGLAIAAATDIWHMYVAFVPYVLGNVIHAVVIDSALSKAVPEEDTGAVMGLGATVFSLSMVLSPVIGAFLMENVGFSSLGLASSAFSGVVFLAMFAF